MIGGLGFSSKVGKDYQLAPPVPLPPLTDTAWAWGDPPKFGKFGSAEQTLPRDRRGKKRKQMVSSCRLSIDSLYDTGAGMS